MSRETTLARAEAIWAEARWREHRARDCYQCSTAARSRKWGELCQEGHALRQAHLAATAELNRNRELDCLPMPDQESLFPNWA